MKLHWERKRNGWSCTGRGTEIGGTGLGMEQKWVELDSESNRTGQSRTGRGKEIGLGREEKFVELDWEGKRNGWSWTGRGTVMNEWIKNGQS